MTYFIPAPDSLASCGLLKTLSNSKENFADFLINQYALDDCYGDQAYGMHIKAFGRWLRNTIQPLINTREFIELEANENYITDETFSCIQNTTLRRRVILFINNYFEDWKRHYCQFPYPDMAHDYAFSRVCEECSDRLDEDGNINCDDQCDSYYEAENSYISDNFDCDTDILKTWWGSMTVTDFPPL